MRLSRKEFFEDREKRSGTRQQKKNTAGIVIAGEKHEQDQQKHFCWINKNTDLVGPVYKAAAAGDQCHPRGVAAHVHFRAGKSVPFD